MILIRNNQRTIKLDTQQLKHNAQQILDALSYSDFDLGIWLTTNKTIKRYNKLYRQKNKPTDILSFAYHNAKPGRRIKPKTEEDKNLGDLIISLEYIQRAAQKLDIPFEKHLQDLLIHGVCHLLGYDHIKDEDYKVMRRKELSLIKRLS